MWDWIVDILFQALKFIQGFAGDWGLAIIILVVIIRLILTPLMLKSTKSTARMQVLQPKLQEMQERYADDPQRLQQEMSKFYAENKFNPLAGCLPLLIQMPILIALFNLLHDLGTYFPEAAAEGFSFYNILPDLATTPGQAFSGGLVAALPYIIALGLFGVLTFIPQMVMARNQTGAQAQSMRMMMVVMTVMMLFMGWGLPAGVLLYYDVSSAWQVAQQLFVTQKVMEKAKAEEEERLANAPIEVDVVRREHKKRPHKSR